MIVYKKKYFVKVNVKIKRQRINIMKQVVGVVLVLFTVMMMVIDVNAESLAELEKKV